MRGWIRSVMSLGVVLAATLAHAGMPRGVVLIAGSQDADDKTGITIARGDAQLHVEKRPISGRADQIEINPVSKQILLSGRASLTVGQKQFDGALIACTLDFNRCTVDADAHALAPTPAAAPRLSEVAVTPTRTPDAAAIMPP